MAITSEAFPIHHSYPHEHGKTVSDRYKGVRKIAGLALKNAQGRLDSLSASRNQAYAHEVASLDQARHEAAVPATQLIDLLSEGRQLDQFGNVTARRQSENGDLISLNYQEKPTKHAVDPNFSSWSLTVQSQGEKGLLIDNYAVKLDHPGGQDGIFLTKLGEYDPKKGDYKKRNEVDSMTNPLPEYNAARDALNFLVGGIGSKETTFSADESRRRRFSLSAREVAQQRHQTILYIRQQKARQQARTEQVLAKAA